MGSWKRNTSEFQSLSQCLRVSYCHLQQKHTSELPTISSQGNHYTEVECDIKSGASTALQGWLCDLLAWAVLRTSIRREYRRWCSQVTYNMETHAQHSPILQWDFWRATNTYQLNCSWSSPLPSFLWHVSHVCVVIWRFWYVSLRAREFCWIYMSNSHSLSG